MSMCIRPKNGCATSYDAFRNMVARWDFYFFNEETD